MFKFSWVKITTFYNFRGECIAEELSKRKLQAHKLCCVPLLVNGSITGHHNRRIVYGGSSWLQTKQNGGYGQIQHNEKTSWPSWTHQI